MMEAIRYFLTSVLVILLPIVAVFWLVMHGGATFWKRMHPAAGYSVAAFAISVVLATVFANLRALAGVDLGANLPLFVLGALIYLASLIPMRRVHQKLDFRTFAGIAEVKDEKEGLLTKGPYAVVRHPRYSLVVVGVVGWALAANYSGGYIVSALFAPVLWLVIWLEERELSARFGAAFDAYKSQTPMLLPSLRTIFNRRANEDSPS